MKKKGKKEKINEFDYQTLFILGICFIGVGVTFFVAVNKVIGSVFIVISILYMIIGIKNKEKWKSK